MQIKTGPFLRSPLTIERIMVDVLISLLPAVVAGLVFFRWRAGLIMLLSTAAAVLTEAVMLRVPLTPKGVFGDGSAAVTGLLLGLILPPGTAWWIPVIGSILAIALVKLPFGGLGHNIFNPALGARAILLLAFTSQLVKFTLPFDVVTGATPLLSERVFSWPLVWGNVAGSIGETSVIAILLGAAYLLYKGHINWRIPVGYVGSAFALAVLWGLDPWYTITAGGLLFAAVFMATDMVTSPVTPSGQLLFGIGCGVLTLVIRQYTPFPEGVTFAVLTMNALAPALESLTIPNIFGVGLTQEARYKGAAISMAVLLVVASVFVVVEKMGPTVAPVISGGRHLPIADLLGIDDYEIVDQGEIRYYLRRDEDGNPFKTAFVAEQKGFNGPIRFLLVLDAEQKIESIRILEHSEDPGLGELITKAAFLDQFIALDRDSGFSLGPDIQGVSGATVSSRALTAGVRRALQQFDAVFYPKEEEVAGWADGVYAGRADSFGGPLEVGVTVEDGQITAVAVKKHSDTPGISDRAIEQIPQAIVKANSPQVDAVSGVTVSSGAIMEAVQNALDASGDRAGLAEPEQKIAALYEITLPDGVYEGSAAGFGGDVILAVTISGGKITDIAVVQSAETPFIAKPAFDQMLPALVEAQAPVDGVSGATVTSKAILAAVESALSGEAAAAEESAALYEITLPDGVYEGSAAGFGGDVILAVTISGGKITDIAVVQSAETPFIAKPAFDQMLPALVEAQAPVDGVSGATVTSKAILAAVESALSGEAAAAEGSAALYEITLPDGVYEGSAAGFGGDVILAVTISGGKITDIAVVQSAETPFIAKPAFDQMLPALVEAQAPVDGVSGATVTSKAILAAVESALSSEAAAATEESAAPYEITLPDGVYEGSAAGRGGDLVLAVTISGGKITDIAVVQSAETEFIAKPAFEQMLPALVEAQAPVDGVSGATITSGAILEAVLSALDSEGGR